MQSVSARAEIRRVEKEAPGIILLTTFCISEMQAPSDYPHPINVLQNLLVYIPLCSAHPVATAGAVLVPSPSPWESLSLQRMSFRGLIPGI